MASGIYISRKIKGNGIKEKEICIGQGLPE